MCQVKTGQNNDSDIDVATSVLCMYMCKPTTAAERDQTWLKAGGVFVIQLHRPEHEESQSTEKHAPRSVKTVLFRDSDRNKTL